MSSRPRSWDKLWCPKRASGSRTSSLRTRSAADSGKYGGKSYSTFVDSKYDRNSVGAGKGGKPVWKTVVPLPKTAPACENLIDCASKGPKIRRKARRQILQSFWRHKFRCANEILIHLPTPDHNASPSHIPTPRACPIPCTFNIWTLQINGCPKVDEFKCPILGHEKIFRL